VADRDLGQLFALEIAEGLVAELDRALVQAIEAIFLD